MTADCNAWQGEGLAYGTKEGRLRLLHPPMPGEASLPQPVTHADLQSSLGETANMPGGHRHGVLLGWPDDWIDEHLHI